MRVFFCAGAAMLLGMIAARYIGIIPCIAAAVLCFCALVLLVIFCKRPKQKTLAVLFTVAVTLLLQSVLSLSAFDVESLNSKTCSFEGTVVGNDISVSGSDYFIVQTDKLDGKSRSVEFYMYGDLPFSPYDKISGSGTFSVKSSSEASRLVSLSPSAGETGTSIIKTGESHSLMRYVSEIRSHIASRVKLCVKSSAYPLLIGMVFGDKSLLSADLSRTFSRCGVSHIFSVSGLHVAIINGIILLLLSKLGLSPKKRAVFSLASLVLITLFVGISKSVLRAVFMAAIINLASLLSRRGDSLNALGFATFIILLFDPSSAYSVSFLLTVAATFGILVLNPKLTALIPPKCPAAVDFFLGSAVISVCAFVGTLPVMLKYFDELSVIGPIVNAVLSPLFVILLPLCFVICFFSPFGFLQPIAAILGNLCSMLFSFVCGFCRIMENLPVSFIPLGFDFLWVCYIIIITVIIAAYIFRNKLPYVKLTAAALCASVLLTSGVVAKIGLKNNVCVYNISASRTNGALIRTDSAAVLLLFSYKNTSNREITSALLSKGVDSVDLIVSLKADNKNLKSVMNGISLSDVVLAEDYQSFQMPLNSFSKIKLTDFNSENEKCVEISSGTSSVIFSKDSLESEENIPSDISVNKKTDYEMILISKDNINCK